MGLPDDLPNNIYGLIAYTIVTVAAVILSTRVKAGADKKDTLQANNAGVIEALIEHHTKQMEGLREEFSEQFQVVNDKYMDVLRILKDASTKVTLEIPPHIRRDTDKL